MYIFEAFFMCTPIIKMTFTNIYYLMLSYSIFFIYQVTAILYPATACHWYVFQVRAAVAGTPGNSLLLKVLPWYSFNAYTWRQLVAETCLLFDSFTTPGDSLRLRRLPCDSLPGDSFLLRCFAYGSNTKWQHIIHMSSMWQLYFTWPQFVTDTSFMWQPHPVTACP